MEEQKKNTLSGPKVAWDLSHDLLRTLRQSDLLTSNKGGEVPVFDILVGIAAFTSQVLDIFEMSAAKQVDIYSLYTQEILPGMRGFTKAAFPGIGKIIKDEHIAS